ncbi:MAG: hypothetical protein ACOYK1_04690 [Vampirovibrionia bacterium]
MSSGTTLNTFFQHMQSNAAAFQQAFTERLNADDNEGAAKLQAQKALKEKTISEGITSVFNTISAWMTVSREAQQIGRG